MMEMRERKRGTGTTGEREGGIRKKTLCVIEKDKGVDWET